MLNHAWAQTERRLQPALRHPWWFGRTINQIISDLGNFRERQITKLRDKLSQARRDLPWVRVTKQYVFDGPEGKQTLGQLFSDRSQLIVYHFMFGPDWEVGCKSCSFWADNFNGIVPHLNQRDVTFVAISRAPLATLQAFAVRLGWSFKWLSSFGNDFNYDYNVSFTQRHLQLRGEQDEHARKPGISVFFKDAEGNVFHTYSCYSRGLEMLNTAYHYLDFLPKGREEAGLPHTMAWVRLRDQYGSWPRS